MCLRSVCHLIVSNKWHEDQKMDETGLNERIINDAARLISSEICNMPYSTDHYPSPSDMLDASVPVVPPLLQLLLKSLVRSELKQTAISQSIIQACRPNSCIMPILFSLGVQLDFQFGSEVLLQELSRLGFCVSYDEIMQFKRSVVCI